MEILMKKTIIITGLLLIGFTFNVFAQTTDNGLNIPFFTFTGNINFMQDDPNYYPTGYDKFSVFGKLGLGFSNIFFGLGSCIAGEFRDSLNLTIHQSLSIAAFGGGLLLRIFAFDFDNWKTNKYYPGRVFLEVIMPFILSYGLMAVGGFNYLRTLLDGFLYPFGLGSPPSSKKSIERKIPELNMGLIPQFDGNFAGLLSFKIHF